MRSQSSGPGSPTCYSRSARSGSTFRAAGSFVSGTRHSPPRSAVSPSRSSHVRHEAHEMATVTYWRQTDATDPRHQEAIHEGVGTIVRRMFFREQSRLPVRFDVWELPPGASEGDHTHGGTSG